MQCLLLNISGHYSSMKVCVRTGHFLFANYTFLDPSLQQNDLSKYILNEKKVKHPPHQDLSSSDFYL